MKILYVTPQGPWIPKYGGAMRNYGILRCLNEHHEVTVALASPDKANAAYFIGSAPREFGRLNVLEPSTESVHARWSFGRAAWGACLFRRSLRQLVDAVQPDVVWYFERQTVRLVGLVRGVPSVVDLCDVQWRKALRAARWQSGGARVISLLKAAASRIEETHLARCSSVTAVAGPDERQLLGRRARVVHIPNGFDFPENPVSRQPVPSRVLFLGSLFYYPNLDGIRWYCNEVWPPDQFGRVPENADASCEVLHEV